MKITIEYNSVWRNSFLDGSNNEPLPKNGREFIASSTKLKEGLKKQRENNLDHNPHFIKRNVTIDTVMGVLNRLIGDRRKLYQSREDINYYFKDIESKVSFYDDTTEWNELVYLRNNNGNFDQNSYSGLLNTLHPLLNSQWADELWNIISLDETEIDDFLNTGNVVHKNAKITPHNIVEVFEKNKKLCPKYSKALYTMLATLKEKYDNDEIEPYLTKTGLLPGIASTGKRNFTAKDFLSFFATGKKLVYGNPYITKEKTKGKGEVVNMLTKADGTLTINIDIDKQKAVELANMIDCAGVSTFTLGKKGLAFVKSVRV